VSGKPWTEQYILPQVIGQYIEANTEYAVEYEEGLGEVAILTPALEKAILMWVNNRNWTAIIL
jgi:glycine betaine/choline ABC-type transport system substrate-binding protein